MELDLAAPSFIGQELTINYDTGVHPLVITGPNDMNGVSEESSAYYSGGESSAATYSDVVTFNGDGQWAILKAIKSGGVLEWRMVIDDGEVVWSGTLT